MGYFSLAILGLSLCGVAYLLHRFPVTLTICRIVRDDTPVRDPAADFMEAQREIERKRKGLT